MERERLTKLLQAPDSVAREDLADLRSLVARYPWFSGAQVLQASGEGLSGDVRSDESLNNAAAHVPSRAVLFDIAKSNEAGLYCKSAPPVKVLPGTADVLPPESLVPMAPQPEEPAVIAVGEVLSVELASAESIEEVVIPEPVAEAPVAVEEIEVEDPLERQIMESAVASAYDLTLHHSVPTSSDMKEEKEVELPSSSNVEAVKEILAEEVPQPVATPPLAQVAPEVSPKEVRVVRAGRKSFSSWLDDVPVVSPAPGVRPAPEVKESPVPPASAAPAPSQEERKSIVDRFISQEIGTVPVKKEFFTPQQAAKRSLDDTAGLVTETLAGIYAKQGNIAKAMDAYRKLALKYPEKSTYFAGLLQTLEAQQHK